MRGSVNDILSEPLSEGDEKIILDHMKRKMKSAAGIAVQLLHAMEDHFGPEARKVLRNMATSFALEQREDTEDPRTDLRTFCNRLDRGCVGSHQWQGVIDNPDCIGYHYTRYMWAEIFRELDEPELGFVICAGDEPAVKSFNPKLGFKRTKVLMNGDIFGML